jgi:GNAT superfamily N-acetyltransferase
MEPNQLFFATEPSPQHAEVRDLPVGYQAEFWAPRGGQLRPAGLGWMPFIVWSLVFHHGRIFSNRSYQLLLIKKDGELVHRSCIFPGYFRFPFMAAADLQVGDTWTAPSERGKGLAGWALASIIRRLATAGTTVWYICDQENAASAAVARKAGMKLVGRGIRTRRFGLNLLGKFQIVGSSPSQNL